jgi:hypothetical protein
VCNVVCYVGMGERESVYVVCYVRVSVYFM